MRTRTSVSFGAPSIGKCVEPIFVNGLYTRDIFSLGTILYYLFTERLPFSIPPMDSWTSTGTFPMMNFSLMKEIQQFLDKGNRLELPKDLSSDVKELITLCWKIVDMDPKQR